MQSGMVRWSAFWLGLCPGCAGAAASWLCEWGSAPSAWLGCVVAAWVGGGMAVTLMTKAAYARHRGCDEKAVRKAINEGRISVIDGKIDPEVADIQWAKNTRARVAQGGDAGGAVQGEIGSVLAPAPALAAAPAPAPDGYTAARARTELANAGRAELELARLRGEVRDVSDISRGGFDIARELRDAMDSSVNTLAAELAPMDSADACATVLRRHNRAIQEMLARGLREKLSLKVTE